MTGSSIVSMTEPSDLSRMPPVSEAAKKRALSGTQYAVRTDEQGRFTIVDQSNYPHVYPVPGKRYADREVAQERADRYNAIKEGKL